MEQDTKDNNYFKTFEEAYDKAMSFWVLNPTYEYVVTEEISSIADGDYYVNLLGEVCRGDLVLIKFTGVKP